MKYLVIALMAFSCLMLQGCCTGPAEPDQTAAAVLHIEGTVVYKEMEGGFFAIESGEGEKYNPVNLPEAFRKDGLEVSVSARPYDGMSAHMYGTLIEIIDIAEP